MGVLSLLHNVPENSFLVPLRFYERTGGRTFFVYLCTRCNTETIKEKKEVKRGNVKSCGCLAKDTRKLNLSRAKGFQKGNQLSKGNEGWKARKSTRNGNTGKIRLTYPSGKFVYIDKTVEL